MARKNPATRMPKAISRTCACDNATERLFARLSETRIMFTASLPPSMGPGERVPTYGDRIHFQAARDQCRAAAACGAARSHQAPAEALPDSCTRESRSSEPGVRGRRYDDCDLRGFGTRCGSPSASHAPTARRSPRYALELKT